VLRSAVQLLRNGEAEVLTMGFLRREPEFPVDSQGRLVDATGRVFNVLHQYDRHPALAERLTQQYASKTDREKDSSIGTGS
jgi:hypothetical protein